MSGVETSSTVAEAAEPVATAPSAPQETNLVSTPVMCLLAIATGIVAAIGAVLLRWLIAICHNLFFYGTFSIHFDGNSFYAPSPFGVFIILAPVIAGVIVVWFVNTFAPEANGHGVPEVIYSIYYNKGNVRGIVSVIKLIASGISIGSGASVGREGPIIQIGASFGSTISRMCKLVRFQKITLLAAGGAAGIAATFNTPLGGVLFAVELLLPEVSTRTFLPVVVATATATYVGRIVLGIDPAFMLPLSQLAEDGVVDPYKLGFFAILGVLGGVASWAFVWFLDWCEEFCPKIPGNAYTTNIIAMLLIGGLNYVFLIFAGHYFVAGVGYGTIQSIFNGTSYTFLFLLLLMVTKIIATSIALGAGASGGVFSPALFIGATLGGAVGVVGNYLLPGHGFSAAEFGLVGMGALVGGSTGAAMTAIVMIFEMTRDYSVIVPLVLAVALAVGVRRQLIADNMYTTRLSRRGTPVPDERHTNMYLVRQAKEVMNKDFVILQADMPVSEAVRVLLSTGSLKHVIVADGGRIAGYVRFGTIPYQPDAFAEQTLRDILSNDYVIARRKMMLNTVIARMNQRNRSYAIVVDGEAVIPRPDDVVGVIETKEIANAVVTNHYA